MTKIVKVMAAMLPHSTADVTIRVRWVLADADAIMTPRGTVDKVSFPHAEDRFRVTLTDEDTGQQRTQDAYPRSYVMLDPPRLHTSLSQHPANPDGEFVDWLPEDKLANWAPVEPRNPVLVDPAAPGKSRALGVGHLLRYSHAEEVTIRVHLLARAKLEHLRSSKTGRFGAMDDAELDTHAAVFAATLQLAPFHPVELFGKLRTILIEQAQMRPLSGPSSMPDWLRDALTGVDQSVAAAPAFINARLAALVHLMLDQDLRISAITVAKEAADMRGLMALRASQGGTVIDYWCDFDKSDDDTPTPICDPANRGKVCLVAEAFGTGLDFVVPLADAGHRWRVDVEHLAAIVAAHEAGAYTLPRSTGLAVQKSRASSFPPPAPASFTASIDYQLVSSHVLDATLTLDEQLEQMMALAKSVTGDGQLTIQVARAHDAAGESFEFDYPYNVYCVWDGESSGALQAYFDDLAPQSPPTLEQLRPFLVTRRYSYRRDIEPALNPDRIAALKLLTEPPHEATLGMPDSITNADGEIPYPSRDDGQAQARISVNLRDILPSPDHAALGVKWERRGGGRPDAYRQGNLWTVELPRPGSDALPADRLPQRYRLWVTAVDIFEQESAPVEVFASEPGEDVDASDYPAAIFVPRWRSPPPPPDNIKTVYTAATQRLEVNWTVGKQLPLGTAIDIDRLALDAEVVVMRRPIREVIAAAPALALLADNDTNPVLQQAIASHEAEGWMRWQRGTIDGPAAPGTPWSIAWKLEEADRGYEYRAVIGHAVPKDLRKFLHRDSVQTVRYLVRSSTGPDDVRYDEAYWQMPESGKLARFRNHPAFSPAARSDVATAMPQANEAPAFNVRLITAGLVDALPVLGVQGIDRDLALAKFITLRDAAATGELSTARELMIDAALARMKAGSLGERASAMVRALIKNEFIAADLGGDERATQHPVIGLRGAVHLCWSDTDSGKKHVPTVLYRVYTARGAASREVHARIRCTGSDTFTVTTQTRTISLARPAMILIDGQSKWNGLATRDGDVLTVRGLRDSPVTQQPPQVGAEYDCWIFEGHVAAEVKSVLEPGQNEFEAALPVAGGHSETGIWWLAAVNCVNEESWLRADGTPTMLTLDLRETIMPASPTRLEARAPRNFKTEAAQAGDYDALRALQVLPDRLQRHEGPIFPRTILTWDPAEYSAAEQYLLIERQDESDPDMLAALAAPDPAWGLLKAIESQAAGAAWSDDYLALLPWLEGGTSPQPPEGLEPEQRKYFFPTTLAGDHAAWKLKDAGMLPASNHPWPNARSLADYFSAPPSDGDRASLTRGERRVRYRAYKMVDLNPGLPGPDPTAFYTRYLVSEPSAWTGWVQADWPPFNFTVAPTETPRAGAPLVRFNVSSGFAHASASGMATQAIGDGELFFRVEIRRKLNTAFGESPTTVLVGELLGIPIPDGRSPIAVQTADYSLERDGPGAATLADYTCRAALVARRESNGHPVDSVLRMADTAQEFKVNVAATTGTVEQALTVELRILVG